MEMSHYRGMWHGSACSPGDVYSNCASSCLRNAVALFHVLEKEIAWRRSNGKADRGFEALRAFKPIIAVGAEHPLEEELLMADHFREMPLTYTTFRTNRYMQMVLTVSTAFTKQ